MYGSHHIRTSSTVQEFIGLSSGESEFYACVRGAATLLGLKALGEDWQLNLGMEVRVRTDSSADGFHNAPRSGQNETRLYKIPADTG
eukprot:4421351-Amphidinium_carterae.9